MFFNEKAQLIADKFENKTAKFLVFWGTLTSLIALVPTIISALIFVYYLCIDIYHLSIYVKKFEKAIEYNNFVNMQGISIDHAEMDSKVVYGINLEQTNGGDYWYFDTVNINGVIRPIIYSANIKQKAHRNGSHIYIQDLKGNHRWIKK